MFLEPIGCKCDSCEAKRKKKRAEARAREAPRHRAEKRRPRPQRRVSRRGRRRKTSVKSQSRQDVEQAGATKATTSNVFEDEAVPPAKAARTRVRRLGASFRSALRRSPMNCSSAKTPTAIA